MSLEARTTLARSDLARLELEGVVRADSFEPVKAMRLIIPGAPVRAEPSLDGEQVDQLLFGEHFEALEVADGFVWGQAARDGYVGWVEAAGLSARLLEPTHRVSALRTYAFANPSIKSPPRGPISLNALVTVTEETETMAQVEGAGWIARRHLTEIGRCFASPADVAEGFLGAPYLWGGRDSLGIDCSGLVQQAFYAAGRGCPRDSDLQARLGVAVEPDRLARGDLVFWRGHVGMMLDGERLLHANAYHMMVAIEPLAEARTRIATAGSGEPITVRRV